MTGASCPQCGGVWRHAEDCPDDIAFRAAAGDPEQTGHTTFVDVVPGVTPPQWRVVCDVCGWLIRVPSLDRADTIARLHALGQLVG